MNSKKMLIVSTMILLPFLSGCGMLPGTKSNELVYSSLNSPDNLIPILKGNEESKYLCELIFDGLVNKTRVDIEGKQVYEWALAERYQENADDERDILTIPLSRGVLWHNGEEFTAEDVIYTWKTINESNSPMKGWLNTFIREMTAVDNYTLRVKLKIERSEEAFKELFSFKILPRILSPDKGEKEKLSLNLNGGSGIVEEFKWKPIGTGPFRIKEHQSSKIVLEANENYFLRKPKIESVRMQRVEDIIVAAKSLKRGQLGLLFEVKPEFFKELDNSSLRSLTYSPYSFYAIMYNMGRVPFSKLSFRKGINFATDKMRLLEGFLAGAPDDINLSSYINTSIFPHNYEFIKAVPENYLSSYIFSQKKAKDFLGSSGITQSTFHLLISSQIYGTNIKMLAQEYVNMMREIGVNVLIDDVTQSNYLKRVEDHDFDAVFILFTGFDHFYDIRDIFGKERRYNISGLHDPNLSELLNQFGTTLSWQRLADITRDIHLRVEELSPGCCLFTLPRRAYYSAKLKYVTVHPEVGFATLESWEFEGS